MEITVAEQTWIFLMSIVLGAALGVCYDVFRILRIAFHHASAAVVLEDVVFSIVCSAASFLYMISVDCGQIRMFVLIGEVVGFAIYYCTIGAIVIGVSKKIIFAIRWVFSLLWRILIAPIVRVFKHLYALLVKFQMFLALYLKTKVKNSNMHLKKHSNLLYNLRKRLQRGRNKKNTEGQGL